MRLVFGIIIALYLVSCKHNEAIFEHNFPRDFPEVSIPESNKMNASAVAIGKKLFFDRSLSSTKTVSCASCHFPQLSFSDGASLSEFGVTKEKLLRHSPALINLAYANNGLFWDGGAKNLESLVFAPLTHPDEMGSNLSDITNYLNKNPFYKKQIKEIYPQEEVKVQFAAKLIAQYVRTLISDQSKYDRFRRGEEHFTKEELLGYKLFQTHCSSCHEEPLLTDNDFHNNGLNSSFEDTSHELMYLGRYRITHDSSDIGKFKTPTLRNVAFTAPYMHDGRFETLNEVLNHYTTGVLQSPSLDPILKKEGSLGVPLTANEKAYLLSFLKTLSDSSFIRSHLQ